MPLLNWSASQPPSEISSSFSDISLHDPDGQTAIRFFCALVARFYLVKAHHYASDGPVIMNRTDTQSKG